MEMKNPPPMMTEKMPTMKPPTRSSAVSRVSSQGASALIHDRAVTVLHPDARADNCTGRASRTAGPRHILDDERLSERARHVVAHDAGRNIGTSACWKRNDYRHRPRRIRLRRRDP